MNKGYFSGKSIEGVFERYITDDKVFGLLKNKGYDFEKRLLPSSCNVYLFNHKKGKRVFKFPKATRDSFGIDHVVGEIEISKNYGEFSCLPKVFGEWNFFEYGDDFLVESKSGSLPFSVEKEYIEGVGLGFYEGEISKKSVDSLKGLVEKLHYDGRFGMDINERNIIVDKMGDLYFVDFGLAKDKVNLPNSCIWEEIDNDDVEYLFDYLFKYNKKRGAFVRERKNPFSLA